jgi:hypothetical protein
MAATVMYNVWVGTGQNGNVIGVQPADQCAINHMVSITPNETDNDGDGYTVDDDCDDDSPFINPGAGISCFAGYGGVSPGETMPVLAGSGA